MHSQAQRGQTLLPFCLVFLKSQQLDIPKVSYSLSEEKKVTLQYTLLCLLHRNSLLMKNTVWKWIWSLLTQQPNTNFTLLTNAINPCVNYHLTHKAISVPKLRLKLCPPLHLGLRQSGNASSSPAARHASDFTPVWLLLLGPRLAQPQAIQARVGSRMFPAKAVPVQVPLFSEQMVLQRADGKGRNTGPDANPEQRA